MEERISISGQIRGTSYVVFILVSCNVILVLFLGLGEDC